MTIQQWLDFFKRSRETKVFHINHLKLLTSMNEQSLRVSLSRLSSKGIIKRICRGVYANPFNPPTLEEIAAQIYHPSYVSLESALSSYGILSQIPLVLTCVTTQLPRSFRTSVGDIEYRQIKAACFWGFVQREGYYVAEPEKAIVDFLYLNKRRKLESTHPELSPVGISMRKLKEYARKMGIDQEGILQVLRRQDM